jgi:acyl-CoA synthetase (AMP-forming)/AMP-acid ligase II
MRSIIEVLREATRHPAPDAVVEYRFEAVTGCYRPGRTSGVAELWECACALGNAAAAAGMRPGDRLAVLADNCLEMIATEWCCLEFGYLWVALNVRSSAEEQSEILADARPSLLVVDEVHAQAAAAITIPEGCRVLVTGDEFLDFLGDATADPPAEAPPAEAPVRIRYTSGTAGRAKGAVLLRRGYDASVATVSETLAPIAADDVLVQVAPMTHASGALLLPYLAAGARALLLDRFDADGFAELIDEERGTAVFLVPTMLVRVLEVGDAARLASLRTVVYGGAAAPVDRLEKGLAMLGPVFVQIYGLTESTWPVTALLREDHLRHDGESEQSWRARLASCGRPTAVGELRILAEDGTLCRAPGEIGEIVVRGANTMVGYWPLDGDRIVDAKGLDAKGWMHTGDVGFRDAEGFVTIVDRLHDMIVSGGFNVYPREVENALSSHPAVLESAVVGRRDPEWGERVTAYVVLRDGAFVTERDLIEHCGQHIAGFKKPRDVRLVSELPRNAAGKVLRRALR